MKAVLIILGAVILAAVGYFFVYIPLQQTELDEALPITETADTAPIPSGVEPEVSPRSEIIPTIGHPASGYVRVVTDGGKSYLRYEDFETINGPVLFVYLSKDTDAKEFVNLGPLKATKGNINYEIPEGVSVEEYPYALIWCKAFSVLFNYADLSTR